PRPLRLPNTHRPGQDRNPTLRSPHKALFLPFRLSSLRAPGVLPAPRMFPVSGVCKTPIFHHAAQSSQQILKGNLPLHHKNELLPWLLPPAVIFLVWSRILFTESFSFFFLLQNYNTACFQSFQNDLHSETGYLLPAWQ